jgi:ATP-dependent exoDNAse (exonuclease V) alpha subunit
MEYPVVLPSQHYLQSPMPGPSPYGVPSASQDLLRAGPSYPLSQDAPSVPSTQPSTPAPNTHALSGEQAAVVGRVLAGERLFITGAAGTGKSFLIASIISALAEQGMTEMNGEVAITALTGIAAINIEGKTIHSWAGVGQANKKRETLVKQAISRLGLVESWKKVKVLIIDESKMNNWLSMFETN